MHLQLLNATSLVDKRTMGLQSDSLLSTLQVHEDRRSSL